MKMEVLYLKCSTYDINFVNVKNCIISLRYKEEEKTVLSDLQEKSMAIIKDQ